MFMYTCVAGTVTFIEWGPGAGGEQDPSVSIREQQGGMRGWRQPGGSGSILLPAEQEQCREPRDAARPRLQASCSPFPPHAATQGPCPGPSAHRSHPAAPTEEPCAHRVLRPLQGSGPGGRRRRRWAGWAPAGWREQRKTMEQPGPRQTLDAGRRGSARGGPRPWGSWQGADPAIAAVEPGWPGAHRILTRRPSVSATFTRTAGTGSFRSRFRAGRSRVQTCQGPRGHGHRWPQPHPGFAPLHGEGETPSAPVPGALCPSASPLPCSSPVRHPKEPQLCSPGD